MPILIKTRKHRTPEKNMDKFYNNAWFDQIYIFYLTLHMQVLWFYFKPFERAIQI